jgi:diketogulonate reductase-like aldo/keto reductase
MAYSPFQQGELLRNRKLATLAASLGMTAAQLAIAWLLAQSGTIAIPQSSNVDHVREFRAAADIRLSEDALKMIDAAFPPPRSARPLAML